MPKNIVVCCDGTGNDFSGQPTNVAKLFAALDRSDPTAQVAFYDPGVGTDTEPGAQNVFARSYRKITGLAFGRGVFRNVIDGYGFLMENYERGDRVYLFGFSRGAYTARALAGMLHKIGLLERGATSLLPYALRLFRTFPRRRKKQDEHWEEVRRFRESFTRPCRTHFVGAWDTVNSIGAWGTVKSLRPLRTIGLQGGTRLNYTASNPGIRHGRHAVSIDEKRSHFRTNLWNQVHSDDHQEVWFAGVHSDVGGGYAETGLSDVALRWMLDAASRFQLLLKDDAFEDVDPDATDKLHNSLVPAWWLLGWRRRRMRGYKDEWPVYVHESVRRRIEAMGGRYAPEIPEGAIEIPSS